MTKWLLVLALGTPMAAHALTADERACQAGRGRAVYDMIAAEGGCIRRCPGRGGAECVPPDGAGGRRCLGGGGTRALRPVLGAACRRDCPACYGGCGPEVASGEVDYSSGLVTPFASIVYCARAPTPAESRC